MRKTAAIVFILVSLVAIPVIVISIKRQVFTRSEASEKSTSSVQPQEQTSDTGVQEFSSTIADSAWEVFVHLVYGYKVSYPPEMRVIGPVDIEDGGNVIDIVRIFSGSRDAVLVLKVLNEQSQAPVVGEGVDVEKNEVFTHQYPLGEKTLEVQGTVYPAGGNVRYGQVLQKMLQKITVP